ncbi:FAD/NAD(P)-binding protein [Gelidibacter salicanalis]|uniref:FAD/NAD(P)-binding protein n=1 Tax=Gelidibacter salicanalis TaxID=291193 RepID=A0A934NH64_9FLAO|nr:FAD/NAD(P)-binding protein [Gelidibacter salicanalis]MBJ7880456.1 FAD/NAD(P)-binding protein [Gelidibacter salicanalis]
MHQLKNLAIIGSGPSAIYLLKNIYAQIDTLKLYIKKITIFEKEKLSGMGMPYRPIMTDVYNLANISSEEIPMLQESFSDWLQKQSIATLNELNVDHKDINEKDVYSRVALGHYFHTQFEQLIDLLKLEGIQITQHCNSEVVDIIPVDDNLFSVKDSKQRNQVFSTVIIATGHGFNDADRPTQGYYASPWSIHKILPKRDELFDFSIGTLGASLSAFDVVTSLSHRHGKFITSDNKLKFIKSEAAPHFKIVLHSAEGWLPHLQYEQQEPIREIYRHFNREQLLKLIDSNGFLHLENYFDQLCRKALTTAFAKDKMTEMGENLQHKEFSFKDFILMMSEKHDHTNSFKGMKTEMLKARQSVEKNIPIHWMETLDDLMYSLNYHAELLPAEDHQFFHKEIMAFLMNVIAALPLQSAEILLALYDANCIELKEGYVTIDEKDTESTTTKITLKPKDGKEKQLDYKLFINCGGEKKMELDDFPFPSLVKQGMVRNATARFHASESAEKMELSGIDIDGAYRTIDKNGKANNNLYDINFTHTSGLRPYSYGLQACNATSKILVESWLADTIEFTKEPQDISEMTKLYEDTDEL